MIDRNRLGAWVRRFLLEYLVAEQTDTRVGIAPTGCNKDIAAA